MKKRIAILFVIVLVLGLVACAGDNTEADCASTEAPPLTDTVRAGEPDVSEEPYVIRIGLVGAFNVHWDAIQEMVAEEGIALELVFFSDFMTPNLALDGGDIDLNAFQHKLFLANEIEANGYEIVAIGDTFIAPLNIFKNADRISSLEDLQDGHTIAIPSDPTNSGRALRLLEAAGLIVLDAPEGAIPSVLDISERIVDIHILEAESGMLFNILPDVEAAVINATNALSAGLRPEEDSIFGEDVTGDGVASLTNVIVARIADIEAGGRRAELFDIIVRAHHSERIRQLILDEYQGALIPIW